MKKQVSILTPTYNRAHTLHSLYTSLLNQTSYDFKWYVVDDGSADDTSNLVKTFDTKNFEIVYTQKLNGGKHTALNIGVSLIEEELTIIVDSDDYLTPNAVETIVADWKKYKGVEKIGGLCYHRMFDNGLRVGPGFPENAAKTALLDTYINVRINGNIGGDKAEVFLTEILKSHPFPVFEGERFLSEAVVWNAISRDGYKLAFIDKGIYVCEYLEGGLTKLGRKYRLQNPLGTMEHAKSFLCKEVKPKLRVKYMLLYTATRPFSSLSVKQAHKQLVRYRGLHLIMLVPGWLLAAYWKRKYML